MFDTVTWQAYRDEMQKLSEGPQPNSPTGPMWGAPAHARPIKAAPARLPKSDLKSVYKPKISPGLGQQQVAAQRLTKATRPGV